MSCGSSNLCLMESPQYIDGGECPPACVTADQLVLWEKYIGHLIRHKGDVKIPLNASQLILQTGVILGCARRYNILDSAHLIYYFKEGGLAQVQ